jgi:hypothetical protein
MTTNYVPNATGLIANQQYRGATWGPNVTSVPIAASHSYNVNPQLRYTSFTGLAPFPTAYATTHPVVSTVKILQSCMVDYIIFFTRL